MTQTWTEPTSQTPQLFLPIITPLDWDTKAPLPRCSEYFITLDKKSLALWTSSPDNPDSTEFYESLLHLCKTMTGFFEICQTLTTFDTKDGPDDHVTIVDTGIEWLIRRWLLHSAPDDQIIGEEGPKPTLDITKRFWTLDPLDGTSNFIQKQPHIALNMAGYNHGKLIFACVINPIQDLEWYGYETNGKRYSNMTFIPSNTTQIGTEYKHTQTEQNRFYNTLLKKHTIKGAQFKSISINLAQLLLIKNPLFYKPNAKIWDMLAPMALFHFAGLDTIFNHIYYSSGKHTIDDNCETVSIESFDEAFIDHINHRIQIDSRIGTAISFHKDLTHIRDEILEFFIQTPLK